MSATRRVAAAVIAAGGWCGLVGGLTMTGGPIAADEFGSPSLLLSFDDVADLDGYAGLGVTFSANGSIFEFSPACSVFDDPECGPASVPNGLCIGDCGGAVGTIELDAPAVAASIIALSGPGDDPLSFGIEVRAFDADGELLDVAVARNDVQFQRLTVAAPGIVRLEVDSPFPNADAWDELRVFFDAPPCPGDLNFDGSVDGEDLEILLGSFGTSGLGAEVTAPIDVANVADLLVLLSNWNGCG